MLKTTGSCSKSERVPLHMDKEIKWKQNPCCGVAVRLLPTRTVHMSGENPILNNSILFFKIYFPGTFPQFKPFELLVVVKSVPEYFFYYY